MCNKAPASKQRGRGADLADTFAGEVGIAVKVILVEGVLNADDGVLLAVGAVLLLQLRARLDLLWVRGLGLEVQVVLLVLKELTGSHIHSNLHLAHIPSFLQQRNMPVGDNASTLVRVLREQPKHIPCAYATQLGT